MHAGKGKQCYLNAPDKKKGAKKSSKKGSKKKSSSYKPY